MSHRTMPRRAPERIIVSPAAGEDLPIVREMFREYARWLGVDLSFQHFEEELGSLPGKYTPPDGLILLARAASGGDEASESDGIAGCVALRRFDARRCEMKRLWIREPFRGQGVGGLLVSAIIDAGRAGPYEAMVLDTLRSMVPARRLYESFGFGETDPYYNNPLPGAIYFSLDL